MVEEVDVGVRATTQFHIVHLACIDYLNDEEQSVNVANWEAEPETVLIPLRETVFRAVRDPADTWPVGQPVWSGCADAADTALVKVAFQTVGNYEIVAANGFENVIIGLVQTVAVHRLEYDDPDTGWTRIKEANGWSWGGSLAFLEGQKVKFRASYANGVEGWPEGFPKWTLNGEPWAPGAGESTVEVTFDAPGEFDFGPHCGNALIPRIVVSTPEIDLDIDSDNNGQYMIPDRSDSEDAMEDVSGDIERPGRLVLVNDDDLDHDFIPGFADGFNRDGLSNNHDDQDATAVFVPVLLEIKAPIRLSTARVWFEYPAVDPSLTTKTGMNQFEQEYAIGDQPDTGLVRLWTSMGSAFRSKAGVNASPAGHYVPPNTWLTPAQLGFTTRQKVFHLEGVRANPQVAGTRIVVKVDPTGDQGLGIAQDAVRCTVLKVDLAAETSIEASEEVPGTALALNDDWDCGAKYGPNAGGDHREREPIWDRDFIGDTPAEKNLLKVSLSARPLDLPGNVSLKLFDGATRVRLWPRASKGDQEDILDATDTGQNYAASSLPKDVYIEGLDIGRSDLRLTYAYQGLTFADQLNLDIVSVRDRVDTQPRVIVPYDTDVTFEVIRSIPAPDRYTYLWDLDGVDGRGGAEWESDTRPEITVKYWQYGGDYGVINLPRTSENRRKIYNTSVQLKAGDLKGGLILPRRIRVALNVHVGPQGSNLTQNQLGVARDADVVTHVTGWSNSSPIIFASTTQPGNKTQEQLNNNFGSDEDTPTYVIRELEAGNRVLFTKRLHSSMNALTYKDGAGATLQVYCALLCPPIWNDLEKAEDLRATAAHEAEHCRQFDSEKNDPNGPWRALATTFDWQSYDKFLEAGGHLVELLHPEVGWYHQICPLQKDLDRFTKTYYVHCVMGLYPDVPAPNQAKVKQLLQDMYDQLNPDFVEMKRPEYDQYVRPPP
jgi:hypothetical protein